MTKISIIVPIYNAENHLRKCLESLVNQTLEEIEIILVNDASPDDSNVIMEEYQQKYPDRVKCIYFKKNMSQGGARNKGIANTMGSVEMPLYYYNIREESTSHLPDAKYHGDSLRSGEMIYKQFKDRDLIKFQEEAEGLYLKQIFNSLRKSVLLFDTLDMKELKYIVRF